MTYEQELLKAAQVFLHKLQTLPALPKKVQKDPLEILVPFYGPVPNVWKTRDHIQDSCITGKELLILINDFKGTYIFK